jgi:hypothetical protein
MSMLRASVYMTGVTVLFGEEEQHDQSPALPRVVVIPIGGPVESNGYSRGSDADIEQKWKLPEELAIKCWAASTIPTALPEDHADAVESLLVLVLSALQDQRMNEGFDASSAGLYFKPVSGRWELMQDAFTRYGRAYSLSVQLEKTYAMGPPPEVSNPTLSLTATITT